jgi:DNA-binding transcriptional MerR regulator/DNA gyrase inhibitor GyrI
MTGLSIQEVARRSGLTEPTLRYYEQIGLLSSLRMPGYAYRVYDETALQRLEQIIALRKLRIPLKKIAALFAESDTRMIATIMLESLLELEEEILGLQTIQSLLRALVLRINSLTNTSSAAELQPNIGPLLGLPRDEFVAGIIQSLSLPKTSLKEEINMVDLSKASDVLSPVTDVRIIYIPPATVAASHFVGEDPEDNARKAIEELVEWCDLLRLKPDLRLYGFNNPSPSLDGPYGYEYWLVIPDELELPAALDKLQKKSFAGGMYAAHAIKMGDFHEWAQFFAWLEHCEEYEYDAREPLGMNGALEEHLNAGNFLAAGAGSIEAIQLDLLIPVKKR